MASSSSASSIVLRITFSEGEEEDIDTIDLFYFIRLSSKITGLNPSVQQKTPVPSSFIQGKLPPNLNVVTVL